MLPTFGRFVGMPTMRAWPGERVVAPATDRLVEWLPKVGRGSDRAAGRG